MGKEIRVSGCGIQGGPFLSESCGGKNEGVMRKFSLFSQQKGKNSICTVKGKNSICTIKTIICGSHRTPALILTY